MSENLMLALQITGVGMGLVFGAIGLLWLMMVVLVRLTIDPVAAPTPVKTDDQTTEPDELKQRAALAAVAVALAQTAQLTPPHFIPPPTSSVSAWQGVMRGRQLKQRGTTR